MNRLPSTSLRCAALLAAAAFCLAVPALRAQAPESPYRITRYEIEAELTPDIHQLRARARLDLVAQQPLASLTLFLNKNLKVEKVSDAAGAALSFEQLPGAESFRIDLRQPLAEGQAATLAVDYVGAFDPALRPERGPLLARISTEGSFLLPPSRWFPQSSNPWDHFAMTLNVTLPAGEVALATGRAEPPATTGGKTRYIFRAAETVLAGTLVAGRYEKFAPASGAPVTFYLRTVPASYADTNAQSIADIIAFFSDKFAPLENPALAVIESAEDTWEAYSAPGLLLLPARQWASAIPPRLLARHLAYLWWAVRVAPATARDAWLAHGLARYSEALYIEHAAGPEALHQSLEDLTIAALVDESAAPIANADQLAPFSPGFNSIVRDKGAMVVQMLRVVLGDAAFLRLLAAYSQRFAGRRTTLDDFQRLAEEVAGPPLDWFFAQWIRSTGIPQFEIEWVIYRTREGFRVDGIIKHELE
ncbi:MAG: hypothetical protein HYY26_07225, partial [Acidobacteria bacterium]|nr:hypothetical protein [Acidobacteriota bacterium]